jgi:hypothetical protein
MPRLIDADKVAEAIAWLDVIDFALWHDVQKCIDKVPTVDAVEVVRCKDCKFASLTYDGECKYCQRWKEKYDGESVSLYLDGDFYCAWGERKEDERQIN